MAEINQNGKQNLNENFNDSSSEFLNSLDIDDLLNDVNTDPSEEEDQSVEDSSQEEDNDIQTRLDELEGKDESELTDEDKSFVEKYKKEEKKEEEEEEELSDEEIKKKLNEIEEKDEKDLSDEDKQFLEEHKLVETRQIVAQQLGIEEYSQFEDTEQGIAQMAEVASQNMAVEIVKDHFSKDPLAARFYDHVFQKGLSAESFVLDPEVVPRDYNKLDLDTEDDQKKAVEIALERKGLDKEDIADLISTAEAAGTLSEKAKNAVKKMTAEDKEKAQKQAKLEEEQKVENANRARKEQEEVVKTLSSGRLLNLPLPKAEAQKLYKFIYSQDEQGVPLPTVTMNNASLDKKLLINYILMNDFKVKGLGDEIKKRVKASTLSSRFKSNKQRSNSLKFKSGGKGDSINEEESQFVTGINMSNAQYKYE